MEFQPAWAWPILICAAALGLRLWLVPAGPRLLPGKTRGAVWLPAFLSRKRDGGAAVSVLGRKAIGAQQAIVLVSVWDQELALCLQAGCAPVVIASRPRETVSRCEEPDCGQDSARREEVPCA